MKRSNLILFAIFIAMFAITGCKKSETFGNPIMTKSVTKIGEILANPAAYEGKTVRVEGEIVDECPGGHWCDIKDETGMIYVEFSGFTLPQKLRAKVAIEGTVMTREAKTMLHGMGVEAK